MPQSLDGRWRDSADYETIAGWLMGACSTRCLPQVGEELSFDGYRFKIRAMRRRRISTVRVERLDDPSPSCVDAVEGDRPGGSVTSEKRLLRSRKALIGGVCAGVSRLFQRRSCHRPYHHGGVHPGLGRAAGHRIHPAVDRAAARTEGRRRRSTCTPSRLHSETYGTFGFGGTRAKPSRGRKCAQSRASGRLAYAHPRTPRPLMCRPAPGGSASRASAAAPADASRFIMRLRRTIRMKGGCMPRRKSSSRRRSRRARA